MAEIEKNNTTLSALKYNMEAEKLHNRTGIFLSNPEVAFNYLWGNPVSIGNRFDINVTQTFDFPTAYLYKSKISNLQNEQLEFEYHKERTSIFLEIRLLCVELISSNILKDEILKRVDDARLVADSYKLKLEIGEANIIEYNKAQVNFLNLNKELELLEIERKTLLSELKQFNGGVDIVLDDVSFHKFDVTSDFESWYKIAEQNNPTLKWLHNEILISQEEAKLIFSLNLPKFELGYMSENTSSEKYHGITFGISIPLWEGKNSSNYIKTKILTAQSIETDNKLRFYNYIKSLYSKVVSLQNMLNEYRSNLQLYNSSEVLLKALNKGEISLIDYINELSFYYESINKVLELEKSLYQAYEELRIYN
jgi:outer membrane protein TolC